MQLSYGIFKNGILHFSTALNNGCFYLGMSEAERALEEPAGKGSSAAFHEHYLLARLR